MPRTKLPEVLRRIAELEREYGLRVGNVFHAGDGNLHPLVLYDEHVPGEADRAQALAEQILVACIDAGGSLTGEHGDRHRQGVLDAAHVRARRPRGHAAAAPRVRPGRPRATRGSSSRRRGSAARCPARTGSTRSRRQALPSVSEAGTSCRVARALDRILEHEAGDLTCTVEAELRLSALQEALAPHGQMLALDPPGDPTLGACLAANLSGPRRHRYGTMRDLVIGATVVLPDGTVASSGGKVVKNVAGYDLGKLLCGSEGRLGRIVRLSLRLHPVPGGECDRRRTARRRPARWPCSARALVPSAVDVHWPDRLAAALRRLGAGGRGAGRGGSRADRRRAGRGRDLGRGGRAAGRSAGRLSFAPGALDEVLAAEEEAVVRVGAGVAYVPHEVPTPRPGRDRARRADPRRRPRR